MREIEVECEATKADVKRLKESLKDNDSDFLIPPMARGHCVMLLG